MHTAVGERSVTLVHSKATWNLTIDPRNKDQLPTTNFRVPRELVGQSPPCQLCSIDIISVSTQHLGNGASHHFSYPKGFESRSEKVAVCFLLLLCDVFISSVIIPI